MCQLPRRNSPSVNAERPMSSCRFTAARTAASSISRNRSAEISFFSSCSRASSTAFGRNRLPTCSARNGGLLRIDIRHPEDSRFVAPAEPRRPIEPLGPRHYRGALCAYGLRNIDTQRWPRLGRLRTGMHHDIDEAARARLERLERVIHTRKRVSLGGDLAEIERANGLVQHVVWCWKHARS